MELPDKKPSFLSIEMLGIIGSFVGLFTFLGGIVFYYYQKSTRLKVTAKTIKQDVELTITNKSEFNIEIEHIRLLKKGLYPKGYFFNENTFFNLVESEEHEFNSNQNDKLNIKIATDDPVLKLAISFEKIESLYHDFLPYKATEMHIIGKLLEPVKMPDCYIGIYLKNGKIIRIKVKEPFYTYYKTSSGKCYEQDFSILMGKQKVKVCFSNFTAYEQHKNKLLNSIFISKKNELLLKK